MRRHHGALTSSEYTPQPLLVLRLRGSQTQMGAQTGELVRAAGGYRETLEFYPRMASSVLSLAIPRRVRGPARRALHLGLTLGAARLHRARRRHFPAYAARSQALLVAAGLGPELARSLAVMDVLQNAVGTVGRMGLLEPTGLQVAAIPACTSLAVWGDSSVDGQLRHARNFDFPGAGVWDRTPSVVFCDPEGDGLRYGFVTTRGADVPGVTAFNEAGLCLTAHTRFHADVNFSGVSVIDFGHEIVRRCSTLDEVRRVASSMRTASSWGFLVSSAREQRALVVETTGSAVACSDPKPGAKHLAHANRYLDPSLAEGEVTSSVSFAIDSDARHRRADEAVARQGGHLSREDLERLLGDTGDPGAPDPEADDRLAGNCIVSAMAVKSVIFEPEARQLRLSVGPAPTGLGPWVDLPYSWDGPVDSWELEPETAHAERPAAIRHYVAATRAHLAGAPPRRVRARLEQAVSAAPTEPNYRFMAAIFAVISTGDFSAASAHLERALEREHGPYRRALLLLWHARTLAAQRRRPEARRAWQTLAEIPDAPGVATLRSAGERESRRPLPRVQLRAAVPDVFLVDAAIPGVTLSA